MIIIISLRAGVALAVRVQLAGELHIGALLHEVAYMCIYMCIYIYIYTLTYDVYIYMCVYLYIYI